jgi:MHS family alpha-ketoglutarate permease-like MFS transporter
MAPIGHAMLVAPSMAESSPKINKRHATALGAGMALEWFDFSVYGLVAALLAPHFFPSGDPVASTLSALGVFAVGFAARPLAAAVFGPMADRAGHKNVLLISVAAMAISTLTMGLLPTYSQVGPWGAVLLVAARLVQGLSTGIEQAVANAAMLELADPRHMGRFACIVSGSVLQAGILCAALVSFVVSGIVGGENMAAWGWRIPFVVGGLAGVVIFYLRRTLPETGANTRENHKPQSTPEVWKGVWKNRLGFVAIIFVVAATQVANYAWTVGLPSLARSSYSEDPTVIFGLMTGLGLIMVVTGPIAGSLCDKYGNSKIFTILRLALAPTMFLLLIYAAPGMWVLAAVVLLGGIVVALNQVLFNYIISTLMPSECRTTGVAVGYGIAVALFGGTSSYILLWAQQHGLFWAFAVYAAALCLISVVLYRLALQKGQIHFGD